jgi:hypothetical protein
MKVGETRQPGPERLTVYHSEEMRQSCGDHGRNRALGARYARPLSHSNRSFLNSKNRPGTKYVRDRNRSRAVSG